jgi:DNA-binding PadR family transcriptional regulator
MTSLFRFGSQTGKKRGLLTLFILHSLHQKPKSGYALLKEIGEKTHGLWAPSKGTIYPLLHTMEKDQLISPQSAGMHSRNNFCLTIKGEETLSQIKAQSRESYRKMAFYKTLIHEIFRNEQISQRGLLLELETVLEEIPPGNEDRILQTLEACLRELREIART